jgi:hypothetical protein
MNYYSVFYWISISDSVKSFFDVMSDIFTFLSIVGLIAFIFVKGAQFFDPPIEAATDEKGKLIRDEDDKLVYKEAPGFIAIRKTISFFFYFTTFFCIIFWAGYVFTPTKKDALLIVAAGGTLQFLSTDSTAKQLPHDMVNFVSTELRAMAKETEIEIKGLATEANYKQELLALPKEELLNKFKTDSIARRLLS